MKMLHVIGVTFSVYRCQCSAYSHWTAHECQWLEGTSSRPPTSQAIQSAPVGTLRGWSGGSLKQTKPVGFTASCGIKSGQWPMGFICIRFVIQAQRPLATAISYMDQPTL